jgi:hypothetical protein
MAEPLDPLDAELENTKAINAIMERYTVDDTTAREMWYLFIETVAKLRDRAKAKGNV